MRIFADNHHTDLYHSLQILFEKRLGHDLYRPIGLDWFHEGFWRVHQARDTAGQYLGDSISSEIPHGIVTVPTPYHNPQIDHKAITLEAFKNSKFDIIIASIPAHIEPFKKLRDLYQPHAKLIFQAGNNWGGLKVENLLTSAKGCFSTIPGANKVYYHQEFSLQEFHPGPCENIKSIMNLQHYSESLGSMQQLEARLPGWEFWYHGAGGKHGPTEALQSGNKMRSVGFVWHVKSTDEGYGYNIHTAFACGKPMIVGHRYQKGFTAEELYIPNETVIDFLTLGVDKTADALKAAADNYDIWTNSVFEQFKSIVDFDKEEVEIVKFLERLK